MRKSLFLSLLLIPVMVFSVNCSKSSTDTILKIGLGGPQPMGVAPITFGSDAKISANIFEQLVTFDLDNKLQPKLAESWSFENGEKELVMKLKKDVKFSSGAPFTAKDVVFSLNTTAKNDFFIKDQLNPRIFTAAEAVDDYTVKFVFPKPNSQFLPQTAANLFIVSEADYNKMGEKGFMMNPVGTGAYKIKEWKAGQYIEITYNENYRGKKPQILGARYILTRDDNTRINMLKAGEVDIATNMPYSAIADFQKEGMNIVKETGTHAQAITFGLVNPAVPWADVKVRQAINYCIDKDSIIEKFYNGVPKKINWQMEWELGYDKNLRSAYPYDPEKAKQLMKEAGYEKGFEMPLSYAATSTGVKDLADYISSSLKQINISCKITPIEMGPQFFGALAKWHDPKTKINILWEIGGPGNPDPVINLTNQYFSQKPSSFYKNQQVDDLIGKALVTVNDKERGKIINEAYKIIDKDLPVIHINMPEYIYITKKNVKYAPTWGGNSPGSMVYDTTIE